MKKIKYFFWRLDIPKKICFIAFIPLFYVTLWTWIGMRFGFILVPLFILDFIICLIPIRVPKEKEIEALLSEHYEGHRVYILNRLDKQAQKSLILFQGFSDRKAAFNRRIGSRVIFPVCRTLGFAFQEDKAIVFLRDNALWEGIEGENGEFEILRGCPATVTRPAYEEGTNVNLFAFRIGDKTFEFCIKNRFEIQEMLEAHKDFFTTGEGLG